MAPARRLRACRKPNLLTWIVALAGAAVLAVGGYVVWNLYFAGTGLPTSVPSCNWPLRLRGHPTNEQAGLIRCYLRALAHHDGGGMLAVADTTSGPVRITSRDFRHAADARQGVATAIFSAPGEDYSYAVTIVFADQARETVAMGLANPESWHSWRLGIGTAAVRHSGPPPAKPSPP
jgi:hypothetical protein